MMYNGIEQAGIILGEKVFPISVINKLEKQEKWPMKVIDLIKQDQLKKLSRWFNDQNTKSMLQLMSQYKNISDVRKLPLYKNPSKIWGIGLNYTEHAADLSEISPNEEPASFMKPATTIIGDGDEIRIPKQSVRTTAEAELGIVIGKTCKNIEIDEVMDVIAGFTTLIDMTAEDILEKNPRFLTRAKSFDTFFSFGPVFVTPDEINDLHELTVRTVINESVHRKNKVKNMTFKPEMLVSFHSKVMTLEPGDIIATGTPGAVHINHGDQVSCQIDYFPTLTNHVIDLKNM